VASVLAPSEGAAEGPSGLAGGRQVRRTTPSGWPADLGLQADGPDGSGPAPTGRVAAPVGTAPGTARDTDRRDHSCRWRPLAAAPASPTTHTGLQSPLARSPVVIGMLKGEAAQRPPTRPGRLHHPLSVAAAPAVRLLGWLAGRAHPPSGWERNRRFQLFATHTQPHRRVLPARLPAHRPTQPTGSLPPTVHPGDAAAATTPAPALPAQVSSTRRARISMA
jgi:hypothetical protein